MALGNSVFVHDASLSQSYTYFRESMFVEHGGFCWWIFIVRSGRFFCEKKLKRHPAISSVFGQQQWDGLLLFIRHRSA